VFAGGWVVSAMWAVAEPMGTEVTDLLAKPMLALGDTLKAKNAAVWHKCGLDTYGQEVRRTATLNPLRSHVDQLRLAAVESVSHVGQLGAPPSPHGCTARSCVRGLPSSGLRRAYVSTVSSSAVWREAERRHPHRPREGGLAHTADTSSTNLAAALSLLSRWRRSKPKGSVLSDASSSQHRPELG
jgi:hypothetical protein